MAGCACTAIGCNNQLQFNASFDLVPGAPYEVRVCFDERCEEAVLEASSTPFERAGMDGSLSLWAGDDRIEFAIGSGDFSGSHHVTFVLNDAEGREIAALDDTVELTKTEPNGGWPCGPTCWSADFEI
jgi:hypothetical protein